MELLSLHGRTDVGLDLVFKSEYPSWGYMAWMNSTTVAIVPLCPRSVACRAGAGLDLRVLGALLRSGSTGSLRTATG